MARLATGLALAAAVTAARKCSLQPYELLADGKQGSSYVDTPSPILSWKLAAAEGFPVLSPARQTACRVVAATSPEALASGQYNAWDSGFRNDSNTIDVPYAGVGLAAPGDTVYWSVIVIDGLGAVCPLAAPAAIVLTPAAAENWFPAAFIAATNEMPQSDCACYDEAPVPLFRKQFALPAARIVSAHLFVTGLGFYRAAINGAPVSDAVLDPAWTTYAKRTLYSAWNVTALLRPGADNAIGISVGRGWWDPYPMRLFGAFDLRDALTVGTPRTLAYLLVTDATGARTVVVTDGSWRVGAGGLRRNSLYIGVQEDARISAALTGWDGPGFDDSGWPRAVPAAERGLGPLRLQAAPPIRVTARYAPTAIVPVRGVPHAYTLSFPANMAGVLALRGVKAPSGAVTSLAFAEVLNSSTGLVNGITNWAGSIGRWNSSTWGDCAPVPAWETDNVTWAGLDGGEDFVPAFTWHAFQHVQVDGWPTATHGPPTAANFEALQFHTDNDGTRSSFASWNPQHAAIDGLARQSFRSNWAGGIQSDCPGRERLGYGGDMLVAADAAMLQFDLRTFYAKRVDDYADAAQANGGLPETAPFMGIASCDLVGGNTGPMQWGAGHSTVLLGHYARYGQARLLEQNYATAARWLALLNASTPVNASTSLSLLTSGLPDFTQSKAQCADACTCPLMTVMGTAFLFQQAQAGARLATLLRRADEAAAYTALAARVKASFLAAFFDPATGRVAAGGLDEQLWGLYLGLVDAGDDAAAFARAVARVAADIVRNGTHAFTGAFGTAFFLRGAPGWGLNDLALQTLSQVDFPSYGWMLANGATALYEHWQTLDELSSFNHAWLGSVAGYLRRYLGGISHDEGTAVGLDALVLQPFPPTYGSAAAEAQVPGQPIPSRGGPLLSRSAPPLPWANTTYESIRGPVAVRWAYSTSAAAGTVTMTVTVATPPNVRCTVHVPHPLAGQPVANRSACAAAVPAAGAGGWDVYTLDYFAGECAFTATAVETGAATL